MNCGDRCSICSVNGKLNKAYARATCPNDTCGMREKIFKGPDTTEEFCKWLLTPQHKDVTAIAHNSKAFDAHFILGYCVDNGVFPEIIFSGTKIMLMNIKQGVSIRFIDSLNFLPMRLKNLPKALNLQGNLKKGDFPHLANTLDNQDYVGPMFAPYYYGVDFMSTDDRNDFFIWYNEQAGKTFNFQQEMLDYTRSDVSILREACTSFRKLIQVVTTIPECGVPGIDPFAHATLASCAMQVIRQLMLYEVHNVTLTDGRSGEAVLRRGTWFFDGDTINPDLISTSNFIKSPIPQIPAQGYGKHHNDSQKSALWLEWISHSKGRHIQHARNGGEFRIPGTRYFVDGIHLQSNTVYEYLGCRFHGHTCLQDRTLRDPRTRMSLKKLYDRTIARLQEIRTLGYSIISIWECHYDKLITTNPVMREFINTCDTVRPLKIRDSFFGGRVEPTTLYYEAQDGERIRYYDVTSLYPFITMSGIYPTSHATVIKDPSSFDYTLQSYYGLAQVRILPPRGLYIPVLPVRCKGKLKFPLCGTCSSRETQSSCKCSDTKRVLFGTWTTPELQEAVKQGYILIKIYEVYHFPTTTKDDAFGSIFTDYVKMFL
jgi:G:T-mismatch repair DNA endonuclease (very short patch repair protein)